MQATNVLITAIKLAEDGSGVILRLYESAGVATTTELHAMAGIRKASVCNLIETPDLDADTCKQTSDHTLDIVMRPFEIKTLLLETDLPHL